MHHTSAHTSELGSRWRRRLRRAAVMAGAALAVGVVVAACGGGPSAPGVATGSSTTTTSHGSGTHGPSLLAYSSCMRAHGVPDFPDPSAGGTGGINNKRAVVSALQAVSKAQGDAAQNTCAHLLPAGGLSGINEVITAKDQQYYLNAVTCMRAHGITDFPDPVFSGGSVSFTEPPGLDTNSPQFTQAEETCRKLIPAGLPDSGSAG